MSLSTAKPVIYTVITDKRVYQVNVTDIKKAIRQMEQLGHKVLSYHMVASGESKSSGKWVR